MTKILCFVGKKSSGKNTLCNFLHGYQLKALNKIDDFNIGEDGKLSVFATNDDDKKVQAYIDPSDASLEYAEWASYNVWPFIKSYSFAEPLKRICIDLFNIPEECLYGTDEQKNTIIDHLLWENMPGVITTEKPQTTKKVTGKLGEYYEATLNGLVYHAPGPMTAREFMQFFGTEIMRKIWGPVWSKRCIENIEYDSSSLAIITDGRFSNELEAVHNAGGKTIYLTRSPYKDGHASENGCSPEECSAIIDNANLTPIETFKEVIKLLNDWGWQ